jgi:hypothetical protein
METTYLRSGFYLCRIAQLLCGTIEIALVLHTGRTAPSVPDESLPATYTVPAVAGNHVPIE